MSKYFTKGTSPVGFYSVMPEGIESVEISDEVWLEMLEAQRIGKVIGADSSGYPLLIERAAATQEELTAIAEAERAARISAAKDTISIWQSELQLGTISDSDKEKLILWIEYIKKLMALDLINAPDIDWPAEPSISAEESSQG